MGEKLPVLRKTLYKLAIYVYIYLSTEYIKFIYLRVVWNWYYMLLPPSFPDSILETFNTNNGGDLLVQQRRVRGWNCPRACTSYGKSIFYINVNLETFSITPGLICKFHKENMEVDNILYFKNYKNICYSVYMLSEMLILHPFILKALQLYFHSQRCCSAH